MRRLSARGAMLGGVLSSTTSSSLVSSSVPQHCQQNQQRAFIGELIFTGFLEEFLPKSKEPKYDACATMAKEDIQKLSGEERTELTVKIETATKDLRAKEKSLDRWDKVYWCFPLFSFFALGYDRPDKSEEKELTRLRKAKALWEEANPQPAAV